MTEVVDGKDSCGVSFHVEQHLIIYECEYTR